MLHEDITRKIIGAAMAVHGEMGPGWDEWDYHRALLGALKSAGLKVESKPRSELLHHGIVADVFEPDLVVEDRVVVEIKHHHGDFHAAHYVQLINYLKFLGKGLGMLINFGLERLVFKRVPYTPVPGAVRRDGPWEAVGRRKDKAEFIAGLCCEILQEYGLGYSHKTYQGLLAAECRFRGCRVRAPLLGPSCGDMTFVAREVDVTVVDQETMVLVTSFRESTRAVDVARLQSYRRSGGMDLGMLVNFGKKEMQLRPVF